MILLDTNVISELMKPAPEAKVEAWLAARSPADCFLSAITEAELRYGIEILPLGQRRQQFKVALDSMLAQDFAGRILDFDSAAAIAYLPPSPLTAVTRADRSARWMPRSPRLHVPSERRLPRETSPISRGAVYQIVVSVISFDLRSFAFICGCILSVW